MADDLHYLELLDVGRRVQSRELSPVEVTEAQLGRIEKLDPGLKSYAHVTPDLAMEQAKAAEAEIAQGRMRGPLHGVPVAVKDLCNTQGIRTAAGMPIRDSYVPDHDATVVTRLREAGAVLLGKLQLTEGAFAEHHPEIPAPVNPWNAEHWSGVSSSGSGVATAAGLCYGSLGSDTGGSIRFPSAANGATGLKPTWGRVSRAGVFELAASLDHIGPITRSAADAGAMLGAIAGPDPADSTAVPNAVPNYLAGLERGVKGLRVGYDPAYNSAGVDSEMQIGVSDVIKVLKDLGADMREVKFPSVDEVVADWVPHCAAETATVHEATYPSQKSAYGPTLAELLDAGHSLSAIDYQKILLRRAAFNGEVAKFFESVDLLVIPAQANASPTIKTMAALGDDPNALPLLLRFTAPFDYTGSPTITMPMGFTGAGTPIAFQLVSRHLEEDLLVRAGYAYQTATDWHRKHPAL
jgi:amidase